MANQKMTQKQKLFCTYYLEYNNASKAYEMAFGKRGTYPAELLKKPHIKAYIDDLKQQMIDERVATLEEVLIFLTDTMRNKDVEMRDRISASEKLGKYHGLFNARVDAQVTTGNFVVNITGIEEENEE